MRSLERRIYKGTKEADNEITEDQERGSRGAYAPDSSICVLGAEQTSIHLLPRGEECTRVYTVVYTRVHYLALSITSVGCSLRAIPRGLHSGSLVHG